MQINICFFMFTIIILIQIKFNTDINNDELSHMFQCCDFLRIMVIYHKNLQCFFLVDLEDALQSIMFVEVGVSFFEKLIGSFKKFP
jgi:hypothetical protein